PEEFEVVKTHTVIGARILSGGKFPLLRLAEEIAFSHHERWDGEGYARIAGIDIPLAGRIVAVADVFDALTQQRPYKEAWPTGGGSGRSIPPWSTPSFASSRILPGCPDIVACS